jgi:hypothetical protein
VDPSCYFQKSNCQSTIFPNLNIHKFNWTSADGKTHNQTDHILIDRRQHSSILDVRWFRVKNYNTEYYLMVVNLCRDWQSINKKVQVHTERFNLK